MERTRKTAASDIARLEAAVKKADLQVHSLQRSLDQKVNVGAVEGVEGGIVW